MTLLRSYEDFIYRVDELGFMALSDILPGFPSLSEETPEENWHTGNTDSDPWRWKDRAAEEKRLAFGCILGGHKGFVAPRMYPVFYKAYHPREHMEERREAGQVSQTAWQLWKLFEEKTLIDTSEIRLELGVTLKKGGSRVDRAIGELQQYYYITVAGNRRKTDRYGQPYGWPANVYDRVENWAPGEWLQLNPDLEQEEARELILANAAALGRKLDIPALKRVLSL